MSHSRIIVLENSNQLETEIDFDSLLEEMQSYGNGVDYIQLSPSTFESDYEWVMNYLSGLGFEKTKDEKGFKIQNSDDFWFDMEKDIKEYLEMGIKENRWKLEDRASMKRGFWIYYDGMLYTLPYFMELEVKERNEFRIEKFLDYHF